MLTEPFNTCLGVPVKFTKFGKPLDYADFHYYRDLASATQHAEMSGGYVLETTPNMIWRVTTPC